MRILSNAQMNFVTIMISCNVKWYEKLKHSLNEMSFIRFTYLAYLVQQVDRRCKRVARTAAYLINRHAFEVAWRNVRAQE